MICIVLLGMNQLNAQQVSPTSNETWIKGPAERFKGTVWVHYFINDSASDFLSSRVKFEPNARSNWHKHAGKQIIFAIQGEGYYMEQGKPLTILKKGDVVVIEPNTIHSHGSLGKQFTQGVMMNEILKPNTTIWMHPVSDSALIK